MDDDAKDPGSCPHTGPRVFLPVSARDGAAVFFATLLLHGLASWLQPDVGRFAKYTAAVEGARDGTVPVDRLLDFSPFYLGAAYVSSALARLVGVDAAIPLVLAQRLLAAAACAAFFWLVARRFGRGWGMAGAALLALDAHLLVYLRILEPEVLLLALLLGCLALLERAGEGQATGSSERAAVMAGLLAASALTTRPTFLPVFLLVPLYLRQMQPRGWRRPSLLFLLPVLVASGLLPVWARTVSGAAGTPVMNPGTVFYEGNQPLSRGT
ncbi:MAG: hypothetical protein MI919_39460, partial [Holophagales bacterium]|nr:hypothetical protein [Holophagales bacterium]